MKYVYFNSMQLPVRLVDTEMLKAKSAFFSTLLTGHCFPGVIGIAQSSQLFTLFGYMIIKSLVVYLGMSEE